MEPNRFSVSTIITKLVTSTSYCNKNPTICVLEHYCHRNEYVRGPRDYFLCQKVTASVILSSASWLVQHKVSFLFQGHVRKCTKIYCIYVHKQQLHLFIQIEIILSTRGKDITTILFTRNLVVILRKIRFRNIMKMYVSFYDYPYDMLH